MKMKMSPESSQVIFTTETVPDLYDLGKLEARLGGRSTTLQGAEYSKELTVSKHELLQALLK